MSEYFEVNLNGTITRIPNDHYKNGKIFIKIDQDGSRAEGAYWEGRRHGNFYITTSSGNIIEETYVDGIRKGRFTISCPHGTYYVGVYNNGIIDTCYKCNKETYDLVSQKFNII